jgi:hypothetical protein
LTGSIPQIIVAAREDEALSYVKAYGSEIKRGRRERGAKNQKYSFAWGFVPSPLATKILTRGLAVAIEETQEKRPVIMYVCYAGTHTSVLSGALHLKTDREKGLDFDANFLASLPYFDQRTTQDIGIPVRLGVDRFGSVVYALGTGWLSRDIEFALCDLIELNVPAAKFCMCNVRSFLNFRSRVGGFLSRRLSLVEPGRRIIASSLCQRIPLIERAVSHCLDLSRDWNDNDRQSRGEVIWLDGYALRREDSPGCKR